jgi:hypothetical protein
MISLLCEVLKMSISGQEVREYIKKNLKNVYEGEKSDNATDVVFVLEPKEKYEIDSVDDKLNAVGWYVADVSSHETGEDEYTFTFKIHPRFPESVSVPKFIYHVISSGPSNDYINQAKKIGLIPRGRDYGRFRYPDRISFFLEKPQLGNFLSTKESMGKNYYGRNKFYLLQINTDNLKGVNFFKDLNMVVDSVFTYQKIPATAISKITLLKDS